MSGWIKLHRKLLNWEWYDDHNTKILFLHLLLIANYKQTRWRGQTIEVGQVFTGLLKLSKDTGISIQSVRTSLDRLKSTNEITIKVTNKYRIITIVNYSTYQEIDEATNNLANNLANNQPTINQQATNNIQEVKNIKKNKNIRNKGIAIRSINDIPNYQDITPNYFIPLNQWLAYKAQMGKGYKSIDAIRKLIKQFPTTEKLQEAVNHSMANNWQGCFAPNGNGSQPKKTTFEKNIESLKRQLSEDQESLIDIFIGEN